MDECHENGFCKVMRAYVPSHFCKIRCPKNKKMPGMVKMAGTFTKAVVKHVASGLKTREQKEIRRIMAICRNCDEYVNKRCRICGCSLLKKIQWATTHCPLPGDSKKW